MKKIIAFFFLIFHYTNSYSENIKSCNFYTEKYGKVFNLPNNLLTSISLVESGIKKEKNDKSIIHTAVREATEELLISDNLITPFGYIDSVDTVEYKFEVYPILCLLENKPKKFNKNEVQKVLEFMKKESARSFVAPKS